MERPTIPMERNTATDRFEPKQNTNVAFLCYTPFTGLGLYGGFRGNRWLRNRITIFKQFVIPSLLSQKDREFVHWISWRPEERSNPHVQELENWLHQIPNYKFVFTYGGLCFWDDKFDDEEAHNRLFRSLQATLPVLMDKLGPVDEVQMLIQPSDDCYSRDSIATMKEMFTVLPETQALTYTHGYICNYYTKEVLEYNPKTNPPFFCIRFPRAEFFDPARHMHYTGPYKSHEYVGDKLKLSYLTGRGFLVGTHGENVSTHFNHPYGGSMVYEGEILDQFGLAFTDPLVLPRSWRKWLMRRLPYKWQKKLRYWFGERLFNRFYNFIRN